MGETLTLSAELRDYALQHSSDEAPILAKLREETQRATTLPQMQISPEQGLFMQVLARALGAKRYLEVGVFTGYSALAMALALPEDGHIVACDISDEWTKIARRYWAEAKVAHKIDLFLAPATETLDKLIDGGHAGTFDMAFIDADKENYHAYYERALSLLRPGGLLMIDNTFWLGKVIDPAVEDAATRAIRKINKTVARDVRVRAVMTPIGDGLTLAAKL